VAGLARYVKLEWEGGEGEELPQELQGFEEEDLADDDILLKYHHALTTKSAEQALSNQQQFKRLVDNLVFDWRINSSLMRRKCIAIGIVNLSKTDVFIVPNLQVGGGGG
jgi:hypothetical protein